MSYSEIPNSSCVIDIDHLLPTQTRGTGLSFGTGFEGPVQPV